MATVGNWSKEAIAMDPADHVGDEVHQHDPRWHRIHRVKNRGAEFVGLTMSQGKPISTEYSKPFEPQVPKPPAGPSIEELQAEQAKLDKPVKDESNTEGPQP